MYLSFSFMFSIPILLYNVCITIYKTFNKINR